MSTEPRTAIVNILVTKPLEINEPDWCIGHRDDRAQFKPDLTHNGPETSATFNGPTGTYTYLHACITQTPYSTIRPEPVPVLAVEIGGDTVSLQPDQVRAFTTAARARLDALDALATEVERLQNGGLG